MVEDGEMRLVVVVLGGREGEVRRMEVMMGSIQLVMMVVVMLPWRIIAESEKKKMKKKKVRFLGL